MSDFQRPCCVFFNLLVAFLFMQIPYFAQLYNLFLKQCLLPGSFPSTQIWHWWHGVQIICAKLCHTVPFCCAIVAFFFWKSSLKTPSFSKTAMYTSSKETVQYIIKGMSNSFASMNTWYICLRSAMNSTFYTHIIVFTFILKTFFLCFYWNWTSISQIYIPTHISIKISALEDMWNVAPLSRIHFQTFTSSFWITLYVIWSLWDFLLSLLLARYRNFSCFSYLVVAVFITFEIDEL